MSSKLIHHAAFLLLLFVLPGFVNVAAAASADPQPKDILTGIYKEAVKGNSAEWLDPKHRDKYLSKSLLRQWTRADKNKEEGDRSIGISPPTPTRSISGISTSR